MLCSDFSTRLMMSRSTDSGEAPGYGKVTTMTGISTSGIWLTRRCRSASRPRHMSTMMMATVVTGCLMLKFERNMDSPCLPGQRLLLGDLGRLGVDAAVHRLSVLERRIREPQHLVALRETRLERVRAAARIALAERQRDFLQFSVGHAPGIRAVALAHHGCAGKSQRRGAPSLDAAFGVQAGDVRLLLRIVEAHQHFDLARGGVRRRIHARHHAGEFTVVEAVDAEPHVLAGAHFADA